MLSSLVLKKFVKLVSSNIYSNVLKAQPERKILMLLTVCYAEYIL